MVKSKREGTVCVICGETKPAYNFVKHRNDVMSDNVGFCKDCVRDNVDEKDNNSVLDMLRLLNIPYVNEVWENALSKESESTFTKYLQLVASKRSYKDFSDTERAGTENPLDDFVVTREMTVRWGAGKSKDQYYDMEASYERLCSIKQPTTKFEEELYVKNVKLGQALDDALESGDSKTIPSLRKTYTDDLKNLGLDLTSVGAEEVGSLGTRIRDWELTKPIPVPDKELSDVDNIQGYIEKYFVIPLKRVFGLASEDEVNSLYE